MRTDRRNVARWIKQIAGEQNLTVTYRVEQVMIRTILAMFGENPITEQNVRDTFDAARTASE